MQRKQPAKVSHGWRRVFMVNQDGARTGPVRVKATQRISR